MKENFPNFRKTSLTVNTNLKLENNMVILTNWQLPSDRSVPLTLQIEQKSRFESLISKKNGFKLSSTNLRSSCVNRSSLTRSTSLKFFAIYTSTDIGNPNLGSVYQVHLMHLITRSVWLINGRKDFLDKSGETEWWKEIKNTKIETNKAI